ncbi:MAG: glutamate 5-kinase [Pseudomonadota bacterium]
MRRTKQAELRESTLSLARRIVIKIGSNVLTAERGLDLRVIGRLCDEIATLKEQGREVILVSSGAIAAGMKKMDLPARPKTVPEQQACAAVGQCGLVMAYEDAFQRSGVRVAQMLLTRDDMAVRKRYLNARNALLALLHWGVVPILNENDTVAVEEIRFGDNDTLSAMICDLASADLLVILSTIDGLYDRDPADPLARLVSLVESVSRKVERYASPSKSELGLGGMTSKLQAAKRVALGGRPTTIANGRLAGVLGRLFAGEAVGTLIMPAEERLNSRKRWIAFACAPRGEIVVDDGACRVLLADGRSLLPSGIVQVRGRFGPGAPVRCVDVRGNEIGVGLVNYNSTDLAKIMGLHSTDIAAALGYHSYDEVIHRDNLVVLKKKAPPRMTA